MKRIHITGCPRSGTTLLTELMRIGFRFDESCEHEMSIFEEPQGNPDLFLSKKPSDIRRIRPLLDADPDLYAIYMVRDPRSVITSEHKHFPGKFFCNFRVWDECDRVARTLVGHSRFLQIRYEELVREPDQVQAAIHEKFPFLEQLNEFSSFHKLATPSENAQAALGGVRAISTAKVAAWRNFLPRVKYELGRHPEMADILITQGYENDDAWLALLDPVSPRRGDCRYPDEQPILKRWESDLRHWRKIRRYIRRSKQRRSR